MTQTFLNDNNINFIAKDDWPPQSPDLNPTGYAIWDSLSEKVYRDRQKPFTEDELKDKIQECWEEISINEIRWSVSCWKKRLRDVVAQREGSTDHLKN